MKITLNVSEIGPRFECDGGSCPVTLAIYKARPSLKPDDVWVTQFDVRIKGVSYPLPKFLKDWIFEYDVNMPVKPFKKTFTLKKNKNG